MFFVSSRFGEMLKRDVIFSEKGKNVKVSGYEYQLNLYICDIIHDGSAFHSEGC